MELCKGTWWSTDFFLRRTHGRGWQKEKQYTDGSRGLLGASHQLFHSLWMTYTGNNLESHLFVKQDCLWTGRLLYFAVSSVSLVFQCTLKRCQNSNDLWAVIGIKSGFNAALPLPSAVFGRSPNAHLRGASQYSVAYEEKHLSVNEVTKKATGWHPFLLHLNQNHVQDDFRKIEHHHFNLKPFDFEVRKPQIFLENCEENTRNRENSLKGYPNWVLWGRVTKHKVILNPRNVGVGCCNWHSM